MENRTLTITLLVCIIFLQVIAINAFAEDEPLDLSFGFALQDFGYKEFSNQNALINREDGWIPGINGLISQHTNNYTLDFFFSYHKGNVVYDGQTQGGSPHKTHTNEQIIDTSLSIGILDAIKLYRPSTLYFGLGYRQWQRDILPTSSVLGLFETYKWYYGFIGGRMELLKQDNFTLWIDGRLTRPINPIMNICLSNYDCVDLGLGVYTGARISLPIHYTLRSNENLIIEPFFESWDFGRSPDTALTINGSPTGDTIYEPRSETRNMGININISRRFK